jgi:hypothetical protein
MSGDKTAPPSTPYERLSLSQKMLLEADALEVRDTSRLAARLLREAAAALSTQSEKEPREITTADTEGNLLKSILILDGNCSDPSLRGAAKLRQLIDDLIVARRGWAIRHVDGRWRTLDASGMAGWTEDLSKALVCRLREHVDGFAGDDPEDVRIVQVVWGSHE